MANLWDFYLRKWLLLEKFAKPDFARLYTLYLSSSFSTELCSAFSSGTCSLFISFVCIYPTVSSSFQSALPGKPYSFFSRLWISLHCSFLTWNLRKFWLKGEKEHVFKGFPFLPNIEGNFFNIKQTCYKNNIHYKIYMQLQCYYKYIFLIREGNRQISYSCKVIFHRDSWIHPMLNYVIKPAI